MTLAAATVAALLVSAGVMRLAQRRARGQLLPGEAGRDIARVRRVPGRVVFLGAVALALVAAGLLAWTVDGGESHPPALPGETVLVIDLSGSITTQGNLMISRTLDSFHNYPPNRRAAVVYFSSTAAIGSPPSAPAADLSGLARLFTPSTTRTRGPWAASFDGGTVISKAIALARTVLRRAQAHHGRVVLLSDLQDNAKDLKHLHRELVRLAAIHAQFELLPLPPTRGNPISLAQLSGPYRAVFGDHIILPRPFLVAGTNGRPVPHTSILRARFPTATLLLGLLLAATALAVSFFPRLAWRAG